MVPAYAAYFLDKPIPRREFFPFLLRARGLAGSGAEIGVASGIFSRTLLRYSALQTLYSVDSWESMPQSRYQDITNGTPRQMKRMFRAAKKNLLPFGSRSVIMRMPSIQAARQFENATLDFVYIDANHAERDVTEDIAAWWPAVKTGGIFAGHDYIDGMLPQGMFGVKTVVDRFVKQQGLRLFITPEKWPSWYVIKENR